MTRGFTLIELLVVITIIVVLLALLTPALDKAIYEAEMVVCGARHRAIAAGMTTYAAGSNRRYPSRGWSHNAGARPNLIHDPATIAPGAPITDDRKLFSTVVSLDAFMDPFVEDIKIDEGSNRADCYIYIPTNVYAGWQFNGAKGMLKLGDSFTSQDYYEAGKINRFDIISADMDQIRSDLIEIHSAHPDKDGKLPLVTFNNTNLVQQIPAFIPAAPHTFSEWVGGLSRGACDYNYARSDNSVFRLNDVTVSHVNNANQTIPGDERVKMVSINAANNNQHLHGVPPSR